MIADGRLENQVKMSQAEAAFLNVDLDLHGGAADVERIISVLSRSVVVMRHNGGDASLEMAQQYPTVELTLRAIAELVEGLPSDARSAWDRLEYRRADVGLRIGDRPDARQLTGAVSLDVLGMMVRTRIEFAYTIYPR